MSTPLSDLLSRPENARIKPSNNATVEATGSRFASQVGRKHIKNRGRPRASHDIVPGKPEKSLSMRETSENDLFDYFQHGLREKDGASCVFLLWGSANSEYSATWAVDVPTTDLDGEDKIFQRLAERYAAERSILRRYLYFKKFSRIKPVTFRLICRSSKRFLVFMQVMDLAKYHEAYSTEKVDAMRSIRYITYWHPDPDPSYCDRDHSGRYSHHNIYCMSNDYPDFDGPACCFERWDLNNDRLRWMDTAGFLSCYFRNPVGARSQNILDGFPDHRFIHYYRNITLPNKIFQAQDRDLELAGLYVETAWSFSKCIYVLTCLLVCVVIGGKVIWGSWEITFGAASFFVAVPMLVLTILSYYEI